MEHAVRFEGRRLLSLVSAIKEPQKMRLALTAGAAAPHYIHLSHRDLVISHVNDRPLLPPVLIPADTEVHAYLGDDEFARFEPASAVATQHALDRAPRAFLDALKDGVATYTTPAGYAEVALNVEEGGEFRYIASRPEVICYINGRLLVGQAILIETGEDVRLSWRGGSFKVERLTSTAPAIVYVPSPVAHDTLAFDPMLSEEERELAVIVLDGCGLVGSGGRPGRTIPYGAGMRALAGFCAAATRRRLGIPFDINAEVEEIGVVRVPDGIPPFETVRLASINGYPLLGGVNPEATRAAEIAIHRVRERLTIEAEGDYYSYVLAHDGETGGPAWDFRFEADWDRVTVLPPLGGHDTPEEEVADLLAPGRLSPVIKALS